MNTNFKPRDKKTAIEDVYEQLLNHITTGVWKENDKIPSENELTELLQVSRNTIRQAIQKLSAIGVIETRRGEGSFVKRIDTGFYMNLLAPTVFLGQSDYMQLFEYEKCIQVGSVTLACEKADEKDLAELETCLSHMKEAGSLEDFNTADLDYHLAIAKATKNDMLYKTMQIIKEMLIGMLQNVADEYGSDSSIHIHEKILAAIKAKDKDQSSLLMQEHMDDISMKFKKILANRL